MSMLIQLTIVIALSLNHVEAIMLIDYALPLAITVLSGWIVFEFLGLCYSQRRFERMRDEE